MLLWPDAENFPVGGEVDFMESGDETRQKTDFFLHYGASNNQLHGQVAIDATQWHNWAVEWAPDHITAYVDGQEWYTTRDTGAFPPGPMHLTLQLDWFPKGGGAVAPSTMSADWVRYYPIDGSGASGTITNSADTGVATASTFVGPHGRRQRVRPATRPPAARTPPATGTATAASLAGHRPPSARESTPRSGDADGAPGGDSGR